MNKLITTLTLFLAFPLFANDSQTATLQEKDLSEYQQTFLFPLEKSDKNGSSLKVSIPEGFKSIQPLEQFAKESENTIEYIPQNEAPYSWTEIITVHKFIGNKISAIAFSNNVLTQILAATQAGKTIKKNSFQKDSIEQAYFIAQYTLNKQQEIIGTAFFSGPYDAAGAQYTIRLQNGQTAKEAIKKIETFFKTQVNIQTF